MCVILLSEKGKAAPTEEQIRNAYKKNPDGAGFAYCDKSDHNKVKWEKGFMTVEELLERLKPLDQWTDTTLAIHFRIGTAGKNDAHTCHPFPISTVFGDLRKTSGEGPVLFHNGVLSTGGFADPLSSDTQDFVIATAPLFKKYNKSKVRDKFIEEFVVGNRVLVMYDDNKVKLYGRWEKSDEGELLVSNKLWEYGSYYSYGGYTNWSNYGAYHTGTAAPAPTTTTTTTTTSTTSTASTSTKRKVYYDDDDAVLTSITKEEVNKLWEQLAQNKYIWFDNRMQFDDMLTSADEIDGSIVIKDGMAYVFDEDEMEAWDASLDGYDF